MAGQKRQWQAMRLTHVGDVAAVMQKKSGPRHDPSVVQNKKRGYGPKD